MDMSELIGRVMSHLQRACKRPTDRRADSRWAATDPANTPISNAIVRLKIDLIISRFGLPEAKSAKGHTRATTVDE